jgi:hypothetical protein
MDQLPSLPGAPVVAHVSVRMAAGYNVISVAKFLEIPLSERMELILQRKVAFLDETGMALPTVDGLRALKELRRGPSSAR